MNREYVIVRIVNFFFSTEFLLNKLKKYLEKELICQQTRN